MYKITVYGSPSCHYCKEAKAFLSKKGVEFEDIDITKDPERRIEMVEKSGQLSIPVIELRKLDKDKKELNEGSRLLVGYKLDDLVDLVVTVKSLDI
jgi:glutaredoxin 3